MEFQEYFPGTTLQWTYDNLMGEIGVSEKTREKVVGFMEPLRIKSEGTHFHYVHSQRTAVITTLIAAMMHMDTKLAFYSGALHDIGKVLIPEEQLTKDSGWTERDARIMRKHVDYSYEMLRGSFDLTAATIIWHHRFQSHGYPKDLPPKLRDYEPSMQGLIPFYGTFLTMADQYDARHRVNDSGRLSGEDIKAYMLDLRPEWRRIIQAGYNEQILTTELCSGSYQSSWQIPRLSTFTSRDLS